MFASLIFYFHCATFLLSGSDTGDKHAIYVSVIEITQTALDIPGHLKVKVFTDDLEDAIANQVGKRINLEQGCEKNLPALSDYLTSHLKMRINDADIVLKIKGCNKNDISHWIDFEYKKVASWEKVELTGDLLMELFPTQSNVFSVKYQDEKRMFRLTNSKKTEILEF